MKTVTLDLAKIKTVDHFYDAYFAAVQAPRWHGKNLDALIDSASTGNINKIDVPYSFEIRNASEVTEEVATFLESFMNVVLAVKRRGDAIELHLT